MAVTRLSVASSNSKTEKKPASSNSKTKKKRAKKVNMSYRIKGTNKVVKVNDNVFMRPSEAGKPPYVARVQKIEKDEKNNDVKVHCQWYYRPEESIMGRRPFHGARELFLSDHYDVQSARTIEGKCIVHDYTKYKNLKSIGRDDYYCRFEYKVATGAFNPDRVAVYCICEMPYNPDDPMVGCDVCKDWFHPACLGMTIEEAKKLKGFACAECSTAEEVKRSQNEVASSPPPEEIKVEAKRRRRR